MKPHVRPVEKVSSTLAPKVKHARQACFICFAP